MPRAHECVCGWGLNGYECAMNQPDFIFSLRPTKILLIGEGRAGTYGNFGIVLVLL